MLVVTKQEIVSEAQTRALNADTSKKQETVLEA